MSTSGQLSVRAGAGTGKTFTMMQRALFLAQQGVPPASILMVTFSVKAAEELKSRLDVAFSTPPPQPQHPQPPPSQPPPPPPGEGAHAHCNCS